MADYWFRRQPLTQVSQILRSVRQIPRSMDFGDDSSPGDYSLPEQFVLYPSYVRKATGSREFIVTVRGWLFSPGAMSRKNRLMIATAERIVGAPIKVDPELTLATERARTLDVPLIDIEQDEKFNSAPPHSALPHRPVSRLPFRSQSPLPSPLRDRMAAVLHKSLGEREVTITIQGANGQERAFYTMTDEGGYVTQNYDVGFQPTNIVVTSRGTETETHPLFLSSEGVSVISDIDDTIKHTGVTGGKREVLQNVFVKDYGEVQLEGVADWYQSLERRGASFHYVSNSPWMLYQPIADFLAYHRFPVGTIHLKHYSGLLNGLLEPVATRKKSTLQQIAQDFPHRKFILIGDSGESDLEAYVDMARKYPEQVLAIFIRDITTPTQKDTDELNEAIEKADTGNETVTLPDMNLIDLEDKPTNSKGEAVPPRPPKPDFLAKRRPVPHLKNIEERKAELVAKHTYGGGVADAVLGMSSAAGAKASTAAACAANKVGNMLLPPRMPPRMPPRLPPRPSHSTGVSPSASSLNVTSTTPTTSSPSTPSMPASEDKPVIVSSAQDYSDYERPESIDKRLFNWKNRMGAARKSLPDNVKLRLYRNPKQVEAESLELVKPLNLM